MSKKPETPPITTPQRSKAIEMIAAERERQQSKEGWTHKHDDTHENAEMAFAAVAYASPVPVKVHAWVTYVCGCRSVGECFCPSRKQQWVDPWPWDASWDKRKKHDRIRALVVAGALIAAEIERLQRKEARNDAAQ